MYFTLAVAPAAFATLPGRDLAGLFIGRALTGLCRLDEAVFAVVFATFAIAARKRRGDALLALSRRVPLVGLLAALVTDRLLIPRMDAMRRSAAGALPPEFAREHAFSVIFLGIAFLCALLLFFLTAAMLREPESAPPPAVPQIPGR